MAEEITFDLQSGNARAVFSRVIEALNDPSKGMRNVSLTLRELVQDTFRDETDPWGKPWPPHSPVTRELRQRAGNFSVQKLVVRDGDPQSLYGSITEVSSDTTAGIEVGGNPGNYPEVHQFGNPNNLMFGGPAAPIPPRPFLPLKTNGDVDVPRDWFIALLAPLEQFLDEATDP